MSENYMLDCACGATSSSWTKGDPLPYPYTKDGITHRFETGAECRPAQLDERPANRERGVKWRAAI